MCSFLRSQLVERHSGCFAILLQLCLSLSLYIVCRYLFTVSCLFLLFIPLASLQSTSLTLPHWIPCGQESFPAIESSARVLIPSVAVITVYTIVHKFWWFFLARISICMAWIVRGSLPNVAMMSWNVLLIGLYFLILHWALVNTTTYNEIGFMLMCYFNCNKFFLL